MDKLGLQLSVILKLWGGKITLDGKLNSPNGKMVMNHATVDGLTGQQLETLFNPTQQNPIPKANNGC